MPNAETLASGIKRRQAIVRYVRKYWKLNGHAPSLSEVADGVGLSSKNAVREHVQTLIREGKLQVTPGKYRTLRVVEE